MKISRNDPCACGSGKKFKKCCGLNAFQATNVQSEAIEHFMQEAIPKLGDIPAFSEEYFNHLAPSGISAVKLLYSCILRPEIEAAAAAVTNAAINRGKREAEKIKKCGSISDLVNMMKAGIDSLNHVLIQNRLLETPLETTRALMTELRSSTRDDFLELSIKIIALAGIDISEELMTIIQKHNKPVYQLSVLCLLLGFYNNRKIPQFLWSYFQYFRSQFPHENYWQGPFYGLWENWATTRQKSQDGNN